MNDKLRKELNVEAYSEWLDRDDESFRFRASATVNGKQYEVSTENEGEEQLVRDTLVELVTKVNRASKFDS